MPPRPEIPYEIVRSVGEEYVNVDVYYTPPTPLKYIKVDFTVSAAFEKVKLKTRFQILKECS
jgi:hypothetical protein